MLLLSPNCSFHIMPGIRKGTEIEQTFLMLIKRYGSSASVGGDEVIMVVEILVTTMWWL